MNKVRLYHRLSRNYLLAWCLLFLGFGVTAVVGWSLFQQAHKLDQIRFDRLVQQTTEALRERLEKYELALTSLADVAASRPSLTRAEWNFHIRLLGPEKSYPGLLELGVAETGARHRARQAHDPESVALNLSLAESNALYLQHAWVRPPSAYDGINPRFFTDKAIEEAASLAARSGSPCYCYRRELSSEIAGNPARGFTIILPLFEPGPGESLTNQAAGAGPELSAWRETHVRGVVFGSIEPNLLLENLFGTAPREIEFDLFSSPPLSHKTWLNARGPDPATLLPGFKAYLRTTAGMQFQAQEWTVSFYTTPLFERESSRYRPWTAIALGATLSALVAALLFIQIHARLRQESTAAELRSACEDLQRVQNERERISRDIHDGSIQSLYGLQLTLGHYDRLRTRQPQAAGKVFEQCRTTVDALIAELRTFIVQQPAEETVSAASSDPALALRQVVQRFQSASSVPIHLLFHLPKPASVSHSQEAHLRQIAQEAISNSLRHGHPRHIHVEFECRDQRLRLSVLDDGSGFDLAQSHAAGQGLANMQARAAQLGGTLHIETQPGRGTRILLEIPLEPEHHAASV
jgi:signal transduction histidine kinase